MCNGQSKQFIQSGFKVSNNGRANFPEIIRIPIARERVSRAKAAYTTRRVDLGIVKQLLTGDIIPKAGDLVLARIECIGQHARIELPSGRRAYLNVGDEIIVTYGARYAPDQFESYVPGDLGPCDLVAAGGVASDCTVKHSQMKKPTRIEPIGLLADIKGAPINLSDWAIPKPSETVDRPKVFAVVGTMMNSGKTTCAATLVCGLKRKGLRVGAAKVTGTGAGGDRWMLTDYGADTVLDFTDAGFPSTFGLTAEQVERIFTDLTNHLAALGCEVIVVEIADGLFQRETAALLTSDIFRGRCDGLLFASRDALGALAGVQHLKQLGHTVLAVGGAMTASPLAIREAIQVLDVPVVTSKNLMAAQRIPLGELTPELSESILIERPRKAPAMDRSEPAPEFVELMSGAVAV